MGELKWASRVSPDKIKKLYADDAKNILNYDLLQEVGISFYARAESIIATNRIHLHNISVLLLVSVWNTENLYNVRGGKNMEYIIIEQTREYKKRISYDPKSNTFSELEHDCLFLQRGFTYPYGWLKGSGTPPEEHLDIFLMSQEDYFLGDELPVKIVGVFKRNDGDHKLIGVLPERDEIDFAELPENEKNALHKLYPRVDEGEGWFGAKTASEIINDFMKNGRVR